MNMQKPKISIIVPICNVEEYLEECLESVISQTFTDIEIICVDDASSDRSPDIIKKFATADDRIIPIFHTENLSTSQARKDGVLQSTGDYIMFLDGDDSYEQDACKIAYETIRSCQTDIVHFGTTILNYGNVPQARIENNQKLCTPYIGTIKTSNLIFPCWSEKKFGFQLWNKIYNGSLCRKAFQYVEDGFFLNGEDLYAFFIIAFFAKSYHGIEDPLYRYKFGTVITGQNVMNKKQFEVLLCEERVARQITKFIKNRGEFNKYEELLNQIQQGFLHECVTRWYNNLAGDFLPQGFDLLCDTFGFEDVLCNLAKNKWFDRSDLAQKIIHADCLQYVPRNNTELKTIAVYYRNIKNGGAQRVVAALCNILSEITDEQGMPRYRVVCITDRDDSEYAEYTLKETVVREYLPEYQLFTKEKYRDRFRVWQDIITRHSIDIVITGMWVAPCTLWDMLCVKGHHTKPAFIIHSHSFCAIPYMWKGKDALEMIYKYALCDGVVILSECDQKYVSNFARNAKYIPNPLTFSDVDHCMSLYEENTILWIGRISSEKQPLDVVYMMEYVVKEIPSAKLYMVGDGDNNILEQLNELIVSRNLSDHVILTGFTKDVEQYYQKASVVVMTSEYEGFSLTIAESLAHGVPVIMYDLPWLTFVRDGRGIITVRQKDYYALSEEVIRFLNNPELCRKIGNEGKCHITELLNTDIGQGWMSLFEQINSQATVYDVPTQQDTEDQIVLKYLTVYQQKVKSDLREKIQELQENIVSLKKQRTSLEKQKISLEKQKISLEKQKNSLEKQKTSLENKVSSLEEWVLSLRKSWSYRIGRVIVFIPGRMKMLFNIIRRQFQ